MSFRPCGSGTGSARATQLPRSLATELTAKGYSLVLPDDLARPPAKGEAITFDGFKLVARKITWSPSDGWATAIECSVIRQDWRTALGVLMERAGFRNQTDLESGGTTDVPASESDGE